MNAKKRHRVLKKLLTRPLLALLLIPIATCAQERSKAELQQMSDVLQQADQAIMWHQFDRSKTLIDMLLEHNIAECIAPQRYNELLIDLARSERELANLETAKGILLKLPYDELVTDQTIDASLLLAHVIHDQGSPSQAYGVLHLLDKTHPKEMWSRPDRAFFSKLTTRLDNHFESQLMRAERAFDGASYRDAKTIYNEVFQTIDESRFPRVNESNLKDEVQARILYRIAECNYRLAEYTELIALIDRLPFDSPTVGSRCYYLAGLACQRLNRGTEALTYLREFLQRSKRGTFEAEDGALELGLAHSSLGSYDQARRILTHRAEQQRFGRIARLAKIALAKIDIAEGEVEAAERRLVDLAATVVDEDPIRYEIASLMGEAALKRGDHLEAVKLLERALPQHNADKARWYSGALYALGCSYLHLGLDQDLATQPVFFHKAETSFRRLITHNNDERAYLGLAQLALAFPNSLEISELQGLLCDESNFTTMERRGEALLLLAELTPTPDDKMGLYRTLTTDPFSTTRSYAQAWLARGKAEFDLAQSEGGDAGGRYLVAANTLDTAAHELARWDEERADEALKLRAQALYNEGSTEARKEALTLASRLAERGEAELIYMRGLIASALRTEGADYGEIALESLNKVVADYPRCDQAPAALQALATIEYQEAEYARAEELFARLSTHYPCSELAASSCFWAAQSCDWLDGAEARARSYRKILYLEYPESPLAAEAYFSAYSMGDYLQGSPEALAHLDDMHHHYPESPFLVVAYYLQGLIEKQSFEEGDPTRLLHRFHAARDQFDRCWATKSIQAVNKNYLIDIRYRAQVEQGLTYLSLGRRNEGSRRTVYLDGAADHFAEIVVDFEKVDHPLTGEIWPQHNYPRVLEEAEHGLAQALVENGWDGDAEKVLSDAIERHEARGIEKGYYVASAWEAQGKLAMQRGEWDVALKLLQRAEEAGLPHNITTDQRLQLWIDQATCYHTMGMNDEALRMLSQVVNDEAASGRRVEAMYLRAQLYEHQGVKDLAMKQLEATARKGGPWATKAQERLKDGYGYN